jgi:hypothetical protein
VIIWIDAESALNISTFSFELKRNSQQNWNRRKVVLTEGISMKSPGSLTLKTAIWKLIYLRWWRKRGLASGNSLGHVQDNNARRKGYKIWKKFVLFDYPASYHYNKIPDTGKTKITLALCSRGSSLRLVWASSKGCTWERKGDFTYQTTAAREK